MARLILVVLSISSLAFAMHFDCVDDDTGTQRCQPPTGPYLCAQGASTYCSCKVVDYQTPYESAKDCSYDCCNGYYNCVDGKCVFDLAGGYPRQSCLEKCGVNTYVCDIQQQKCVLSDKPGATVESTCNANCGRGSVILCVYQCTGWIWQTCQLKDPSDRLRIHSLRSQMSKLSISDPLSA